MSTDQNGMNPYQKAVWGMAAASLLGYMWCRWELPLWTLGLVWMFPMAMAQAAAAKRERSE
jgi:hypothetical protein